MRGNLNNRSNFGYDQTGYAGIRHQVGLELVEVDIQRPVETQGRRDRGHHLSNQAVEIREARGIHPNPLFADVVDCFIVNLHRTKLLDGSNLGTSTHTMNEQSECSRVVCVVRTEL